MNSNPLAPRRPLRRSLAALLLIGLLTACFGPQPTILSVNKQPPSDPTQPYRVQVLIHNTGVGDGQVQVTVRLVDKGDGHTILSNDQDVSLDKDEQQSVNFELNLPPSAPPAAAIDVQVQAQYPIE
ncbi:MAG: hypothetical protein M3Z04_15430 [Chloroflexota bacterium]|nr:hypothetical protein [Chloroflexota bacterium]